MSKIPFIVCLSLMLAAPAIGAPIRTTVETIDYPAAAAFCAANPCPMSGVQTMVLTDELESGIRRINRQVNGAVRYVRDHGDVWEIAGHTGDCEDYLLRKRRDLIALGFSPASLRIGFIERKGEGHALLLVETDKGTFVLDSISDRIRMVEDVRLVQIQSRDRFDLFHGVIRE